MYDLRIRKGFPYPGWRVEVVKIYSLSGKVFPCKFLYWTMNLLRETSIKILHKN